MFRRLRQSISRPSHQPSGNEPALGGRGAELAQSPRLGGAAGLLHTLEALTDEDWQVRMRAVEALGEMSSDEVLDSLAQALRDSSHHVREHAAGALGRMGSNEALNILIRALYDNEIPKAVTTAGLAHFPRREAVEHLIHALDNESQTERQLAIDALVRIGSMASPWLIEALHRPYTAVIPGALETLGRIGGQIEDAEERGRYFDAIAPLIERQDDRVRDEAYLAIGRLRDPRALSLLDERLDSDWHLSHDAMKALGQMGELGVSTILEGLLSETGARRSNAEWAFYYINPNAIASLLTQVGNLRPECRNTLLSRIESLNEAAIATLRELLSSHDRTLRLTAAAILSTLETSLRMQRTEVGVDFALQHRDPDVRYEAARRLAKAPRRYLGHTPILIELVRDVDKRVRIAAIQILRRQRQGEQALIDALSDEHLGVRREAIRALGRIPSAESARALIDILHGPERELHAAAAEALRELDGEEVISVLIEALGPSYTTATRRKAARSLAEKHSQRGVAPLLVAIGNRNHNVRAAAARALSKLVRHLQGQSQYSETTQALREGLEHTDPIVRLHAAYNLGYLGNAAGASILAEALVSDKPTPYLNTWAIQEALDRIH